MAIVDSNLWVATSELPRTAGHPFYQLNGLFNEHGDFVEGVCEVLCRRMEPGSGSLLSAAAGGVSKGSERNEELPFSGTAVSGIETERVAV